ncbi:MAG: hypothetical protein BroJett018_23040 [Chloroflexota bacterium]|nr:hypothetical protein [Chloroflexota bacterium]NOG63251.1 hypothetical protein [Chloroflexota bacterium]GIK64510.1 MAG: hypothetical protein BroJett018_23040 [Chloroflexota bacterium]
MHLRGKLKWALFLIIFLVLSSSILFFNDVPKTKGQETTSGESCVLTPEILGGQGFSVSGLGFSVSGLGFSVSGLGFSVSGLGFSVSGLGLDPAQVAQEIRDNPISNQWLLDLQPDITAGSDFNTTHVAILILDDFSTPNSHGNEVLAVFNDLASVVDMSKILLVPIDIGGGSTGYRTENLKAVVRNAIEGPGGLLDQGYKHFVINMSFGIIPCEDPGMVIDDTPIPPFKFDEAVSWIDGYEPVTNGAVIPTLDCVAKQTDGKYVAWFGYDNTNDVMVNTPVGTNNRFNPTPTDRQQPRVFEPGDWHKVFSVKFSHGTTLVWKLKGPDGVERTVSANKYSTPCESVPATSTNAVKPIVNCVADAGDGVFVARFGYENHNMVSVTIPVGTNNYVIPNPQDRKQTITFLPGVHNDVFRVNFNGSDLTWKLKSPDGNYYRVIANKYSPPCSDEVGVGLTDYLTRQMGVPEDKLDYYLFKLTQSADDEAQLADFRGLLKEYLERSAESDGEFAVIPVASSGNFRPWLGSWPLSPARWPEVIATGATLGNNGPLWQFSHDGNVIAPGAGFPYGDNTFLAGTSFAAPYVSMVGAQWLTYPKACLFDGQYPPLTENALGKDLNAAFVPGVAGPYNCLPDRSSAEWRLIESNDPIVARSGSWANVNTGSASGGSYLYASRARNTYLKFDFEGETLEVIYISGPKLGTFTIVVDGVAVRTVNTYSYKTEYGKTEVINYLTPGPHTVKIVPAYGTVAIDAFYAAVND